ncbi:hypothetical protein MMC10_005172 [Thelotrema lepadinum]|nr:hypothetical protein [Thelotrema lepadinum]
MSGYLDDVLYIFEQHDHPFVLVGLYGMRWNGVDTVHSENIEVVVSDQKMNSIADSLLKTGSWIPYTPPNPPRPYQGQTTSDPSRELWLKHSPGFGPLNEIQYLHFYTENLYNLSLTSCLEHEAPDLRALQGAALEEDYDRDPHQRFFPETFAKLDAEYHALLEEDPDEFPLVLGPDLARSPDNKIPIFIPSIAAHVNALCHHAQNGSGVNYTYGRGPGDFLIYYVKDLYLDWPPTREWFLKEKMEEENRHYMRDLIEGWHRRPDSIFDEEGKYLFEQLEWEIPIPEEGEGSTCDERCGWCVWRESREGENKGKRRGKRQRVREEGGNGKEAEVSVLVKELADDWELPLP